MPVTRFCYRHGVCALPALLFSAWICLAGPVACAAEYRVLPNMKVELDGRPIEVGPIVEAATSTLVPLGKAVTALSREKAVPDDDTAQPYRIRVGDQVVLELPVGSATGGQNNPQAVILGSRKVPLKEYPEKIKLSNEPERLMIDLKTLAGLMGITMDQDGATISLFTPEYWCEKLGLGGQAAEGRTFKNLSLLPDMGISPPAKSLLDKKAGCT